MGVLRAPVESSAAGRLALRHLRHRLSAKSPHSPQFSSLPLKPRWFCAIAASKSKSISSFSSLHSESFFHSWDLPPADGIGGPRDGVSMDEGAAWTAVLLGWLGAEHKHLRRYAEMYGARGIRTISFVVPVGELVFDLGKGIEGKVARFAAELADWAEGEEEDGRGRRLLFHTFSNTGWFTYGAILESLRSRKEVIGKISGCVVDSGADPEINPQVWAAGFAAALFKKRGSLALASEEFIEANNAGYKPAAQQNLAELIVLSVLEKIFSVILRLPDVNRRLSKIISILSNEQPPCPQLYLYSSADRVIPARSVEMFIETQQTIGREVHAYDFRLSPHVDHLRAFPLLYSSKLHYFLKGCTTKRL